MIDIERALVDVFCIGYRLGESNKKTLDVATQNEILSDAVPMVSNYLHEESSVIELRESGGQEANVD